MKLLALLATTAAFLTSTLAAPVESNDSSAKGKAPQAAAASKYGTPQCKSAMMNDLCISNNANAYCDVTGFHNDFMKSCAGNCFCA
ncbi:hypothetical protein VTG60DRAFT_4838 [Thermothelomyces hinnuleus]